MAIAVSLRGGVAAAAVYVAWLAAFMTAINGVAAVWRRGCCIRRGVAAYAQLPTASMAAWRRSNVANQLIANSSVRGSVFSGSAYHRGV